MVEKFCLEHQSDKYIAFRTGPVLMEFCDPRVTKRDALKRYANKKGITLDKVMAFGDTSNDNSMLEICYGVCLQNGSDDTKAVAKDITDLPCKESGFADYLSKNLWD